MPKTTCPCCGGVNAWTWEEAFEKFGFQDGDGDIQTPLVAHMLKRAGYEIAHARWGIHNDLITSVKRRGLECIPATVRIGYDDPRGYLPKAIVNLLDAKLPADLDLTGEVVS